MYKLYDLTTSGHLAVRNLADALLNNISANTFEIVDTLEEADCLLLYGTINSPEGESRTEASGLQGDPTLLENIEATKKFAENVIHKRKIVMLDQLYTETVEKYPAYLKATDMIINFSGVPPKQENTVQWVGVENNNFYQMQGVQRIPRSAVVSADHAREEPELFNVVVNTLDKVFVTMDPNFQHPSPKVETGQFDEYPRDIRRVLNKVEFVVHLYNQQGPEIMGIEGGLCGAKPIYPANSVQKSIYSDVQGVGLFSLVTPAESLEKLLTSSSVWSKNQDDFVKKFAAENNAPAVWDRIKSHFDKSPE